MRVSVSGSCASRGLRPLSIIRMSFRSTDADEADAVLFIAMRYVEGGDLAKRLAGDGWLEPAEALSIVERVADALDAAHRRGLVHRDVKPGNILISGEGHVYLSDFWLTRQTQETSALTESGQFVGTLDYVAPEQIENQDVSAQTGVYALSCVLFQCLTGTVPFSATSKVGLMFAHLQNERPSARERNPELAAGIDAVLAKGMAKRRQDRYDTATELAEDARPALGLSGEITLPSSAPTFDRRRLLAIGGTSAALIAAAITVPAVLLTRGNGGAATVAFEPDDSVIETIAGTGARGFSGDGGPALEAALSNPVAVVFDASGNLYVATPATTGSERSTPTA